MDGPVIGVWITSSVAVIGVVYSIVKNGKSRTKQDTELKTELKLELKAVKDKLDDPNDGLGAIRRELSSQREHCAGVTSGFEQRIKGLEKRRPNASTFLEKSQREDADQQP